MQVELDRHVVVKELCPHLLIVDGIETFKQESVCLLRTLNGKWTWIIIEIPRNKYPRWQLTEAQYAGQGSRSLSRRGERDQILYRH